MGYKLSVGFEQPLIIAYRIAYAYRVVLIIMDNPGFVILSAN